MALYEYECPKHGRFELIQPMTADLKANCPECGRKSGRLPSSPALAKVIWKEQRPLGTGAKGRYISHKETGGLPILIPSFGALEQEEIDYVAEEAIGKEQERVKNRVREPSLMSRKISAYTDLAYKTKPGQRAKVIREAMKQEG